MGVHILTPVRSGIEILAGIIIIIQNRGRASDHPAKYETAKIMTIMIIPSYFGSAVHP